MPERSSWMPCAPQGVKGFDGDVPRHNFTCSDQFISEVVILNAKSTFMLSFKF